MAKWSTACSPRTPSPPAIRPGHDELKAAIDGAADLVVQIQAVIAKGDGPTERDIVSALENAKPRLPAIRYMNVSRS